MIEANDPIKAFEPLWGNWMAEDLLGQGTYGRVYRMARIDAPQYKSALKHIIIPGNQAELEGIRNMGIDEASMQTFFDDMSQRIMKEIEIMYSLRGEANIVGYEDHALIRSRDGLRSDIFIRMELLVPLSDYIADHALPPAEVRRLGVELCTALEACGAYGIIHRDIKEGNVFLNPRGTFKLGDFGIARELAGGNKGLSMRGTPAYIAPEVYKGQRYDARADLYSLGILMYKLLNGGRYPFLPPAPERITVEDTEVAFARRIKGERPAPPAQGDAALHAIVLQAIEYDPAKRFPSPQAMKAALEGAIDLSPYPVAPPKAAFPPQSATSPSQEATERAGGKITGLVVGIGIAAAVLIGLVTALVMAIVKHDGASPAPASASAVEAVTPAPTPAYPTFHSAVFEGLIRQRLNKPTGHITFAELEAIDSLAIIGDFARADYFSYYVSGDNDNRLNGSFTYEDGLRYPRGQLNDISDITLLKNLKRLYISCTSLADISPLASLTQLEELRLSSNIYLADISPLANLTNLRGELSLWRNDISDLSPLANLYGIDKLTISSNNITDLTPLSNLTNLTYINLYKNQVWDITPLEGLVNLTYLQLNENEIYDLTPIAGLYQLEELRIQNNNIEDIRVLYYLPNLQYVNVRGNPIYDYSPLAHIPKVEY